MLMIPFVVKFIAGDGDREFILDHVCFFYAFLNAK